MLLLILVAEFVAGAVQLGRRFRLLASALRHLFPSSPKIVGKGTVYAPFSFVDKGSPAREPDSWKDEYQDIDITVGYELVSQFN